MQEIATSEDHLLGGRIRVRQPVRGYRVNVDSLLLAAAVEAPSGGRFLEAGCGVGAALLAVAVRNENARFLGVERDQNIAALARENVALNAMSARVEIAAGDALDRAAPWGVFDGVFANPPYEAEGRGRGPDISRAYAHLTDRSLDEWVAALADRLTGGAALTLIHRAAKIPEILRALDGRLGGAELIPILPRADQPAHRVVLRARKGSRAPFKLCPALVLHDDSAAKYTPEAEAILQGAASLDFP